VLCYSARVRSPAICALVLGLLAVHAPRAAAAEPRTYGDYDGAFWGFEARAGAVFRTDDPGLEPIAGLGLGLRAATLLSLIDVELGLETFAATRLAGPEGDKTDHDLRRTSVIGEARLHPLFVRALEGGFGARLLASIHVSLGGALELMWVGGKAQDQTNVGVGVRVGVGAEVPLTDPSARSWSLWLGAAWRLTVVGFSAAPRGLGDMDQQGVWLSLSLRFHGVDFARIPKPPELNDDDD